MGEDVRYQTMGEDVIVVAWADSVGRLGPDATAAITAARELGGSPVTLVGLVRTDPNHATTADETPSALPDHLILPMSGPDTFDPCSVEAAVAAEPLTSDRTGLLVAGLAARTHAKAVVVEAGLDAEDLVPRIAGELRAAAIPECHSLEAITEPMTTGGDTAPEGRRQRWIAGVKLFGGAVDAVVEVTGTRVVASFDRPGPARGATKPVVLAAEPVSAELDPSDDGGEMRWMASQNAESGGDVPLEEATRIVAGGRGIGGSEGFGELTLLAEALGADLASSRPPCDTGWVPRGLQVGITGHRVAPELYVAVAISGSIQHRAGMSRSGFVVAINRDADAAIFEHADVGVVGDWREVVAGMIAGLTHRPAVPGTADRPEVVVASGNDEARPSEQGSTRVGTS